MTAHDTLFPRSCADLDAVLDEAFACGMQNSETGLSELKSRLRGAMGGETAAATSDDLRAAGWMVAVHNDYELRGRQHTFWLFKKGGRAVKGEGRTDALALRQARAAAAAEDALAQEALKARPNWIEKWSRTIASMPSQVERELTAASAPPPVEVDPAASPDDLRAAGWMVAVHNDFRLAGTPHTYWAFTRGKDCITGEGETDADALNKVRGALA